MVFQKKGKLLLVNKRFLKTIRNLSCQRIGRKARDRKNYRILGICPINRLQGCNSNRNKGNKGNNRIKRDYKSNRSNKNNRNAAKDKRKQVMKNRINKYKDQTISRKIKKY